MFTRSLFFVLCLAAGAAPKVGAQNQLPVFSNVRVENDPDHARLALYYDLHDPEEDSLDVSLQVVAGGRSYTLRSDSLEGDAGYPVVAGTGKRIYWYYGKRGLPRAGARLRLIADDRYPVDIQGLVDQVDSLRLEKSLLALYGPREHFTAKGGVHLEKTKDYIESQLAASRIATRRQDTLLAEFKLGKKYNFTNLKVENVIGSLDGLADDSATYVLCGHFDTTEKSPGGDDNASGVAGMLEAARILSQYTFRNSIRFIGFDMEEVGFLGSRYYVFGKGIQKHEKISGVINFDMIGYCSEQPNTQLIPDGYDIVFPEAVRRVSSDAYRGNFVINTANEESRELGAHFARAARRYVPDLKVISLVAHKLGKFTPQLASSDHAVFWMKGYEALHIGDGGDTRNLRKDTRRDTEDMINYTFMSRVVKASVATMAELAGICHSTVYTVDLPEAHGNNGK